MKYLLSALCLAASSLVGATTFEQSKIVTCGETKFIYDFLTGHETNEAIVWVGQSDETKFQTAMFVNTKTMTWTLIQYDEKMACVLSDGTGFKVKPLKSPDKSNNKPDQKSSW